MNDGELVCPMCYPDLVVYGEVIPGWTLAFQDEEHREVPAKHYALFSHHHEPCFVWPQKPIDSTYDKYGREEANTWTEDDPRSIQESEHINNVLAMMDHHFQCDIMTGYHLVKDCIEAGYKFQNSGMPIFWLTNRMARLMEAYSK